MGRSPSARKAQAFRWLIAAMPLLALGALVLLGLDQWRSEPAAMTPTSAAAPSAASPVSVAVLPFVNMSEDPDTGYFSDGIAEELLNQLTRVGGLQVASRTSSFRFRDNGVQPMPDLREIGRQLEVRYVIEGSVRRAGDDLRVTVQLIDVLDGFHRWSHTYEARWDDVFDLQEEMTRAIVEQVAPRLIPEGLATGDDVREGSPRAYELYLLGRHYWHQRQPESLQQAAAYFHQALAIQPDSVLALTGLAETYLVMVQYGGLEKSEALAKAEPLLAKALALAPDLSESHLALGHLHFLRAEWDAAETELIKSLTLNENLAMAHMLLGNVYNETGRLDQAYASYREALLRDPLHATVLMNLSQVSLKLGLFERARDNLARATSLFPAHTFLLGLNTHIAISSGDASAAASLLLQWQSQQEQGVASLRSSDALACGMLSVYLQQRETAERCLTAALAGEGAEALQGSSRMLALNHLALVRTGSSTDATSSDLARSVLREFERDSAFSRDEVAIYELAVAYAQLGDDGTALGHLRRSIKLGRRDYGWVRHDRRWQTLKHLPAFEASLDSLQTLQRALRNSVLDRFPGEHDERGTAEDDLVRRGDN